MWLHFHIQLHQIITLQHNTMLIGLLFLETFQQEPATKLFDESFAPFLILHERFARQHRSRPSNTYNVSSANTRKDHNLSGIKNIILLYRMYPKKKFISISLSFRLFILLNQSHYIFKLHDSCFQTRRIMMYILFY